MRNIKNDVFKLKAVRDIQRCFFLCVLSPTESYPMERKFKNRIKAIESVAGTIRHEKVFEIADETYSHCRIMIWFF